ncbi:MAG TPA: RNA polymerase sigma factor SigF [Mycobacteriales bacterium]|nr:RNA polymerase sigma factor SigF [Mycobacteriales bacterium]
MADEPEAEPGSAERRERTEQLFALIAELADDDPKRQQARDEIVELNLPLVHYLAGRFRGRGEPYEDLVQVGTIGLLKAVDRFDSERGVAFSTYASPTVVGEIRRYFRDKGWAIRVPRRIQEIKLELSAATDELTHKLGRSPRVSELAEHMGLPREDVVEGLLAATAYAPMSLDAPEDDDGSLTGHETLGIEEEGLSRVEDVASIGPLLDSLAPRERRIIVLRFFENKTQSQIAAEVGLSQMHVSRLLAKTLAQLREHLTDDGSAAT